MAAFFAGGARLAEEGEEMDYEGAAAAAGGYDDDDDDYYDEGEADEMDVRPARRGPDGSSHRSHAWLPPGADVAVQEPFGMGLDEHFWIPRRLQYKAASLVEAVNDFHFAMLNDHPRNEFYRLALEKACASAPVVMEIGTGSGLLAMIAAKAGARHVYAVEASTHMAAVARANIAANGLEDKVTVINAMSTDAILGRDVPERATVLVSEILGTLLLGESALQYVADTRERLLTPDAHIIPSGGQQFAVLLQAEDIATITEVHDWSGVDLRRMNSLKDTVSVVFTKQYGFRLSSIEHSLLADPVSIADVDFYTDGPGCLPTERTYSITVKQSGICHAIMFYWEVYSDQEKTHVMSTDPRETTHNFPRDMQWGQALQLVEDWSQEDGEDPKPMHVTAGETLTMTVRYSLDSAVFQCMVSRNPVEEVN